MNSFSGNNAAALSRLLIAWQQALFLQILPDNRATSFLSGLVYLEMQNHLQPDMSLEIGAHQAEHSQRMRRLFPRIEVVAFEASPAVHAHFKASEQFAGKNIAYLNMAVSDANGKMKFNALEEFNGLSGRNSLISRPELPSKAVEVLATTGDSFLDGYAQNSIALWIDVEGAAGKVLPGLEKSLENKRFSSVFIEVEGEEMWPGQWLDTRVTEFFLDNGYVPVLCDAEHCPPAYETRQYNLIFMPASRVDSALLDFLVSTYVRLAGSLEKAPGPKR